MSVASWLFDLDPAAGEGIVLAGLLDDRECERAARFRAPIDRARFVARRGRLRQILGQALGCSPRAVRFGEGAFGKPFVEGGPYFSISSSGSVALCAISTSAEIGCDIERREPALADPAVAERLLAPGERRQLAALPAERWIEGFFDCWTRKEAVVKALGLGLSYPLDRFEVALTPGAQGALSSPLDGLQLHGFALPGRLHAAICVASDAPVAAPEWRCLGDVRPDWETCPDHPSQNTRGFVAGQIQSKMGELA
jgi:4'-phosphopantetheinyl transferase